RSGAKRRPPLQPRCTNTKQQWSVTKRSVRLDVFPAPVQGLGGGSSVLGSPPSLSVRNTDARRWASAICPLLIIRSSHPRKLAASWKRNAVLLAESNGSVLVWPSPSTTI